MHSAGIPRSVGYRQLIEPSEGLADQADQVDETVGVTPLVVVPADYLDLIANHLGELGIEDARAWIGHDVAGDDRVAGVLQVSLERTVGSRLHDAVDLLDRGLPRRFDGQVSCRASRNWYAQGVTV